MAAPVRRWVYNNLDAQRKWLPYVQKAAKEYGVSEYVPYMMGFLGVESRFGTDPNAYSRARINSDYGLVQQTPGWYKTYGVGNRLNDYDQIKSLANFFAKNVHKVRDRPELLAIAYNAGDGRLAQVLRGRSIGSLPAVTQGYIPGVQAYVNAFRNGKLNLGSSLTANTPTVEKVVDRFGMKKPTPFVTPTSLAEGLGVDSDKPPILGDGNSLEGFQTPATNSEPPTRYVEALETAYKPEPIRYIDINSLSLDPRLRPNAPRWGS